MKNKILFAILFFFLQFNLISQENHLKNYPTENIINQTDSVWMSNLPEIKMPENYRNRDLPVSVDNSTFPWFRPIFAQESASCGQSAGIGYIFTYEIDRARNLPADTSINQFPTHFAWNFGNSGNGWYGVSYFHSFEILRVLGTPNVNDYGGMFIDEGFTWITGYDKYYGAMKNRITGVSQIKANTPEGLLILKNWLNDHLDGSAYGGVAGFYAVSPWALKLLPAESPQAGKYVITNFQGTVATHAMTIVGYDDSIRYDYNFDGQFTNHLDINFDGVVDMRDWEIGGVKFANSYGDTWADLGFCYMMYKVIADDLQDGGIWNHSVHILDVKPEYTPELTMKLTVKHDSREKIIIMSGVSNDTTSLLPEHIVSYPFFDYSGGHQYMQGHRDEEAKKTIEVGLDLTPLLSYVTPGKPARFFVVIDENDPKNEGTGEIVSYSIMDYTNGVTEIHCPEEHVPIAESSTTRLAVNHTLDFDKIEIVNDELPAVIEGQPYEVQLTAEGGTLPGKWELAGKYYQQSYPADFPVIEAVPLAPASGAVQYAEQEIEFYFPFYGETFNKLFIHQSGFIMFEGDLYPWPYYNDAFLLFKSVKNISVFLNEPLKYYPPLTDGDGMWYEGDETHAAFRWSIPIMAFEDVIGHAEFAVILYPDGTIRYFYNDIEADEDLLWYAGVSKGNKEEYKMLGWSNTKTLPRKGGYAMIPDLPPQQMHLGNNGLLAGNPELNSEINNISVKVTDDKNISTSKTFQLSDGLVFSYQINAGGDSLIQIGDTIKTDLKIKNITTSAFHNLQINIAGNYPYLEIIDGSATIGTINPGQTITATNALTMCVADSCPDKYSFILNLEFYTSEKNWTGKLIFETSVPGLFLSNQRIVDDNNHKLDPGETVEIYITVTNDGSAAASDVSGLLTTSDPFITINTSGPLAFGNLAPGQSRELAFTISANASTPISHVADFIFKISAIPEIEQDENFSLVIGQIPVLVINLAQNSTSSDAMIAALQGVGIVFNTTDSVPAKLELYRSVFLCLGTFYQNKPLSANEGSELAAYLDNGGKLYMEGAITWKQDPQTLVHPKFNINVNASGWVNYLQIKGVQGTFTENMIFNSNAQNKIINYYFAPVGPAFPVFRLDNSTVRNSAIANENENYRTIGSFTEFGSLESIATLDDRELLMKNYLEFFGLADFITSSPETGGTPTGEAKTSNFPNPFSIQTSISFRIAESTETELIIYDIFGKTISKLLPNQLLSTGDYSVKWDSEDDQKNPVPPGLYFYQIRMGEIVRTGKMIRLDK